MFDQQNPTIFSPRELRLEASVDNLERVQAFVEQGLEELSCPLKIQMQISLAVEEIFVNIALYAYAPGTGEVAVSLERTGEPGAVILRFTDRGTPYNPLAKEDPNTHLPAEEREIGGLGILMTKKLTDGMDYEYRDGQNILTLKKIL